MNYCALFLNNNSYIEKCLTLIRFISNPESKSLPHITLRVFRQSNTRLEDVMNTKISYLNIIEPGTFNIDENLPPYVVYIRCGSKDFEGIEHKPDFPRSRPHITLYEGDNLDYAKDLYSLLRKKNWHFKLKFDEPRVLTEKKVGSKTTSKNFTQNIELFFNQIIGESINEFFSNREDTNYKLYLIEKILCNLDKYLAKNTSEVNQIDSYFSETNEALIGHTANFIDASKDNITYKDNQLSFDSLHSEIAPYVEKPVQDAIYVTPPEYARDMAKCALDAFGDNSRKIDFGDSAIGTGALFLAVTHLVDDINERENTKYSFNSAIGIDIDKEMAREAFIRYGKRGLTVIYGDAISPDIELQTLGLSRNLMLVNPPYNRHQDIPREYRLQAYRLAEAQTGIKVMGDAGLYVYHLLIMDKWLSKDGIAVWLLPSIFLQSRYGEAVRQYLLNNVQLIKLHVYDDKKVQFDNTFISTTIVIFKKNIPNESSDIIVSYGDSVTQPQLETVVDKKTLQEASGNWRRIIYSDGKKHDPTTCNLSEIKFEDLFDIKRGLATGANSFFVMERSEAKRLEIPDIALKPLLPKARYLKSLIINPQDDGYPDVEPQLVLIDSDLEEKIIRTRYPSLFNYLQTAKKKENGEQSIVERALVSSRQPWYKQEKREAPPYLLTYMGRSKKDLPPLYFILNKSKAIALNTYLLLYPREWLMNLLKENNALYEIILSALNESAERIIQQQTRVYSGGLQKLEPGELKGLPIVDLPDEIVMAFNASR